MRVRANSRWWPRHRRPAGLTSEEASRRLAKSGPNAMPDTALHPLARAVAQLWAPVPGMLELVIVLELALGRYVEGAFIAVLLGANAALGFFQEGRAQATLSAMKSRLALNASVGGTMFGLRCLRRILWWEIW